MRSPTREAKKPKGYNGGDIINGAGNRVGVEYNMSSSGFKQNQFPTGVVRAKTKGTVSFADVFPDGYVSRNPKVVAASYLDYDSGEERVYDQPVEYIQGTFAAEDAPNVIWHETADVSSKKLITERWDKTVADPFYQSAVPAYTAKVGALKIQYAYPNDAWVLFQTDEDGVRHFAPDQERATVSGVSITGLKQNIVLYSDFCMNVFIPVSEMYDLEVSYGDLVLPMIEREIDGALYYAVCVTVGADQAADRITLDLAFTIGGQVFNDTVSTNVAAYAASLAKSEEYADLGYAMLRYAKAAYLYTTEENVAPNALNIADTDAHAEMATAVNTAVENAVVTGVSVNLGEKPVFILFFDETFAGTVTVSYTGVNGESKSVVKEVRVGDGQIGLPEIKLYDLAETLTISVNGEEIRTYNLAAYVGSLAGDDAAIAVAVALYDYVVAAKNYILR